MSTFDEFPLPRVPARPLAPRAQMTGTLPIEITHLPIVSEIKYEYNR